VAGGYGPDLVDQTGVGGEVAGLPAWQGPIDALPLRVILAEPDDRKRA
jgi:hypothetical protein